MAFDDKSVLNNKLSSLIEGQVPDFVQADHPVFVDFLKDYYKFLEAGLLTISTTTDYVALETSSSSYILREEDGDRVVTELGAGTKGYFVEGETITGSTSNATAKVLIDDSRNSRIYITSQQKFITGETITGGTSGSEGTVVEYRANPVQNIQQLLDYADVDNTIYDFLDKMRDSFMTDIPDNLASGISRRDLLKNIKDLYSAKGTSEGHKLFMRILLGEDPEIFYPNQYMIKPSAAQYEVEKVMRVLAFENVDGEEVVNQVVTGQTSGATATVVSAIVTQQTSDNFNDSVTEFSIAGINGTFIDGEIVTAVSTENDREVKFTLFGIISDITVTRGKTGSLYSKDEIIELEGVGNNFATAIVDQINTGSVSKVAVDDAGTDYEVGDVLTFTSNSADPDAVAATGEVSMVGGGILQESGTVAEEENKWDGYGLFASATDNIIMESSTSLSLVPFNFILEETREDKFISDGSSTSYSLTNINADNDTIEVFLNDIFFPTTVATAVRGSVSTNWTASSSTLTFSDINDIPTGTLITVRHTQDNYLILNGTDITGTADAGHKIESNTTIEKLDDPFFKKSDVRNPIVLEYDTFENLGVTSERGSIQKIKINNVSQDTANYYGKKNINRGYTKLPTISVTSVSGTGAKLLAISDDIGSIKSVKVTDTGFRYSSTNPPEVEFRSHFIVKDVTGTFVAGNTLTTHTGTVKSWDSTTNELIVANFEDTIKVVQEQDGTFQEGIQLEQGTELLTPARFRLEQEHQNLETGFTKIVDGQEVTVDEDRIVLDAINEFDPYKIGTDIFGDFTGFLGRRATKREIINVSAEYDENSKTWAFLLDGKKRKNITFFEDVEYYFNLSDPSLYGNEIGTPIEILQKSFALSRTPDGTNDSGTRETTFITTTQKYGVNGVLDVIRVGAGNIESMNWKPSTDLSAEAQALYTWSSDLVDYEPPSYYNPRFSSKGIEDEDTFGTSQTWTADELYSIQQGYTGAYLKITLPINAIHLNNYYYYSPNFSGMGGKITVKRKSKIVQGEGVPVVFNALDKEEHGFILESGSQDSGGNTDHLIMEDGVDFLNLRDLGGIALEDGMLEVGSIFLDSYRDDDIARGKGGVYKLGLEGNSHGPTLTDALVIKNRGVRAPDDQITDAQYLKLFYSLNTLGTATDLQGYLNFQNKRYEPTFFLNEDYIPPREAFPLFDFSNKIRITPEPKDFITPIENQGLVRAAQNISAQALNAIKKNGQLLGFSRSARELALRCGTGPFFPKKVFNEDGFVLIDSYRENEEDGFIVLNGTDANGSDDGDFLASEEFGNTLVLERTDLVGASGSGSSATGGTDARDKILLDDETGDGNILLDATASGVDVGDEVLLEHDLDFNRPITITDSGGASATVEFINRARGTSVVNSISTKTGVYRGINHLLGEDLIRLQDSYYYQDYSYEVIIGDSLVSYIDELRKAVHPAGFQPFGKVSIATLVSAAVTNTAAGVSDYTKDTTTFSPILASTLETIFSQVLQSRLQVPTSSAHDGHVVAGSFDDKIVQETGVLPGENLVLDVTTEFNLVLDGIDSNSTDAGDAIVLDGTDDSATNAGDNITILDDGSNIIFEDENLLSELGVDSIVLDGTDEHSSNAGDNIRINAGTGIDLEIGLTTTSTDSFLFEDATVTSTDDITSGVGDGGGRIMSETSYAPSGQADRIIFSTIVKKLESKPLPKFERNLLLYLAETPFGSEPCGITLESGSGNLTDNIIMDGEIPFGEGSAFMELERDTQIDNIVLDGTDSLGSDAGDGLVLETGFFLKIEDPSLGRESETFRILFEDDGKLQLEASIYAFPVGFRVSDGDKLLLDTLDNDETITLSDIGSLTFEDIRTPDKIEIQGLNANEQNWGGGADDDNIILEGFGQILLDGSDSDGTDAGHHLLQETSKRNRFELEQNGNLIFEKFSTLSNVAAIELETGVQDEIGDDLILEDVKQHTIVPNIKLELSNDEGIIILDGTDSSSTNAGDKIELEDFFNIDTNFKLVLEEHNVFASEGQIPDAHYRLNSTSVITKGNVRSAEISVRDTGDITLEDGTADDLGYNGHAYLVLNGIDGSSTNAGENIDLEGATGITY